jgi:hypothetical protein
MARSRRHGPPFPLAITPGFTPSQPRCHRGPRPGTRIASDEPVSAKLLALALPITGSLALLIGLPILFAGGDPGPTPSCATVAGATADLDAIAATIRQRESGGDYQARADGSTASGAYQFTDATWADHGGYPHAWQAPPAVQDTKALDHINGILAANDGHTSAVPVVWYIGYLPAPDDPAWDTVPNPEAGNRLTPRQYQDAWLGSYANLISPNTEAARASPDAPPTRPVGCNTDTDQQNHSSTATGHLTTVEGITVDSQIAPQVQQLVEGARRSGHQLTGTGYRSHERQIELRRQHCGTSNYAIYEMPSSQCSPPTARPGTSLHEQGLAIDFDNCSSRSTACHQWLAANAATYGFFNLPSEPWHWSTSGA